MIATYKEFQVGAITAMYDYEIKEMEEILSEVLNDRPIGEISDVIAETGNG